MIGEIRNNIQLGKIKNALSLFETLMSTSNNESLQDSYYLLSARFYRNEKDRIDAVISQQEYDLIMNNISNSLLKLLRDVSLDSVSISSRKNETSLIEMLHNPSSISVFFDEAAKLPFLGGDLFMFNRLKEEYYAGLEGIKFVDWTRRMTVFISKYI